MSIPLDVVSTLALWLSDVPEKVLGAFSVLLCRGFLIVRWYNSRSIDFDIYVE